MTVEEVLHDKESGGYTLATFKAAVISLDYFLDGIGVRLQALPIPPAIDEWFIDTIAGDANRCFDRLMAIDTEMERAALKGAVGQDEHRFAVLTVEALVRKWLQKCGGLFRDISPLVPGVKRLRQNTIEAEAMLEPKMEVAGKIATLLDAAISEHRAGMTIPLLEGLPK